MNGPYIDRTTPPRPGHWHPEEIAGLMLIGMAFLLGFVFALVLVVIWGVVTR